ncbi:uncharacterized protein RAG0_08996 [Rhynchosporium agropyri]|uniref:Uncharacterized protein n=1 Tax=Rhynchosporium agropyri TaxID=914238 RepID=A0A1E1KT99_9HELO|nr:uncharacterized protein RAG0_08996 [Rhynchosporium agropyri]
MDISKLLNAREQSPVDISEHPASTEGLASQPASSSDKPGTTNEDVQNLPVAGAEQQDTPMGDESTQGLSFQSTSIGDTSGTTNAEVNSLTAENREDQDILTAAATLQRLSAQAASINLSRETTNMEVGSTPEGVTTHQYRAPVAPTFTGLGRRGLNLCLEQIPSKLTSTYTPSIDTDQITTREQTHSSGAATLSHPLQSHPPGPVTGKGQTSNPAPEVYRSGSNDPASTKKTGEIQTEQSDSSSKSKKTRPRWVEDPNSERGKRLLSVPPFMLNNNIDAANMVESDPQTGRPRRQPPENDNVNGEAGDDDHNKRIDGDDVSEIAK